MDVLNKLDFHDIINISKICLIIDVYSKTKSKLLKEIDVEKNKRGKELSTRVKKYFIKENIIKTLPTNNTEMLSVLNINDPLYLDKLVNKHKYNTKVIANNFYPSPKYLLYNKYNVVKFCYQNDPNMTKEWFINTYVIPFVFYSNMSMNVLVPNATGVVKVKNLKKSNVLRDIPFRTLTNEPNTNEHYFAYIITPFVKESLVDLVYKNDTNKEDYYYIFQVMYTLACFGKLGITHNDVHCGNIRTRNVTPKHVRFVVDDVTFYDVKIDKEILLYDFDLGTVDGFMKHTLQPYKINLDSYNNVQHRPLMSVKSDEGRRDMIIFLTRYLFTYYDRTLYLINQETMHNKKRNYFLMMCCENNAKKTLD